MGPKYKEVVVKVLSLMRESFQIAFKDAELAATCKELIGEEKNLAL